MSTPRIGTTLDVAGQEETVIKTVTKPDKLVAYTLTPDGAVRKIPNPSNQPI